jgi:RNA polymerase sigma-70 factor (ECF subfamily)
VRVRDETVAEYIDRRRAPLVGALMLHCGSREVAEELAQEAFVRLWQRWSTVDDPDPWVHRVAFNLARSQWRRRRAERRAIEIIGSRPTPPGAVDPAGGAVADAVAAALGGLTERQREMVVRRYYLDEPVATIADAMRCAPGTVKATLHQAVARLRQLHPDLDGEL